MTCGDRYSRQVTDVSVRLVGRTGTHWQSVGVWLVPGGGGGDGDGDGIGTGGGGGGGAGGMGRGISVVSCSQTHCVCAAGPTIYLLAIKDGALVLLKSVTHSLIHSLAHSFILHVLYR